MRVPIRKGSSRLFEQKDSVMTQQKYDELKSKLDFLKNVKRPKEAEEVKRLALMGDFSENAAYQLAKGRLRGINQRILDIEDSLKKADIIEKSEDLSIVNLGNKVSVEIDGKEKSFIILGSSETKPEIGIISHLSPLGSSLLKKRIGETGIINLNGKEKKYKIINIE